MFLNFMTKIVYTFLTIASTNHVFLCDIHHISCIFMWYPSYIMYFYVISIFQKRVLKTSSRNWKFIAIVNILNFMRFEQIKLVKNLKQL